MTCKRNASSLPTMARRVAVALWPLLLAAPRPSDCAPATPFGSDVASPTTAPIPVPADGSAATAADYGLQSMHSDANGPDSNIHTGGGSEHLSLEEIAYKYGTDKSKDDHKYVDLYMMLFDPIRTRVRNVTEVGVAHGQSLRMWHDYFANAVVWGVDNKPAHKSLPSYFRRLGRTRMVLLDAYALKAHDVQRLRWVEESMDVIIDDAVHKTPQMQHLLILLWRFVKPGGYYIIEDVGPESAGDPLFSWFHEENASPEVARIVRDSTCFFADTLWGHRNWTAFAKTTMWNQTITEDRYYHNSHMIVLRKRLPEHPPRPSLRRYFGDGPLGQGGGAMRREWFFLNDSEREEAMLGSREERAEAAISRARQAEESRFHAHG